jgi:3D (Asp-Asp-Asp) domain-containing protein
MSLFANAAEISGPAADANPTEVGITLIVDDVASTFQTTAGRSVGDILTERNVAYDAHDRLEPASDALLRAGDTIRLSHLNTWTETVRQPIAAKVRNVPSLRVAVGKTRILDRGQDGLKEIVYIISRDADRAHLQRSLLSSKTIRAPRARVIAHGIGEYALTQLALRGVEATARFAGAAMKMIATAYTASCAGCSGTTAIGRPAGHGIVAVDPSVIPLGTHLYIPGYGRAVAGDTGGAIRGNRIDLGFESTSDAFQFGTRPIIVYVLAK